MGHVQPPSVSLLLYDQHLLLVTVNPAEWLREFTQNVLSGPPGAVGGIAGASWHDASHMQAPSDIARIGAHDGAMVREVRCVRQ